MPQVMKSIKKRKWIFDKEKRHTEEWKKAKKCTDNLIKDAKKRYLDNQVDKVAEEGAHTIPYRPIKNLQTKDMPKLWDVRDLRPGVEDEVVAEELANFFNNISKEFGH